MSEANEFGTQLSIEERQGGAIALILNGGKFDNAEVLITSQQARDVGEVLVRYGLHAQTGIETPKGQALKEMIRKKMANRVLMVSKNLTDRGYSPEYIAQEAVDICLRELF